MTFESTTPSTTRFDGLAVFCSDGRYAFPCGEVLRSGLGWTGCDHVAVPGGPGALVGHREARLPHDAVLDDVAFLVESHGIRRAALVAHEGCAFYTHRLGLSRERLREVQEEDLARAARQLRQRLPHLEVEGYFAAPAEDGRLRLARVPLGEPGADG